MDIPEKLPASPITLPKDVNYEALKEAHEKGSVEINGQKISEDSLYPQGIVQQDAQRIFNNELNSAKSIQEVGMIADKLNEVASQIALPPEDLHRIGETKNKSIDLLMLAEKIKSTDVSDEKFSEAVNTAEQLLYGEATPAQKTVLEAVIERISQGQEGNSIDAFVGTLRWKTRNGNSEIASKFAVESLVKILETDTATPAIKLEALEGIEDISKIDSKFDQRGADILVGILNKEPEEGNEEQAKYLLRAKEIVINTAESMVYVSEPTPAQKTVLEALVQNIDIDSANISERIIGTFAYVAESTQRNRDKRIAASPFRHYLEGKSKNKIIAGMDRSRVAKMAYSI